MIWQDLASRQREEAARRAIAADAEQRLREDLAQAVQLAGLPPEELARIRDEQRKRAEEWDRLPGEQWKAAAHTPEAQQQVRRYQMARHLETPVARALALLLGRFTRRQWELLRSGAPLFLSTDPQPGEGRLPAETARALRATRPSLYPPFLSPELRSFLADPERQERVRQREKELQDQWAAATGHPVTIWMEGLGGRSGSLLSLRASAAATRGGAPGGEPYPAGSFGGALGTSFTLDTWAVDRWQRDREDTPERSALLAKDPVLGARQPFQPELSRALATGEGTPRWTYRDLLPDLARTYAVQFIADAYWQVGWSSDPRSVASTEPRALFALLDRLVRSTHRWDRVGSVVRVRSRTWFFDRPREIPLRLVRRWQTRFDQDGGLSLAEYVAITRGLSERQLMSLDLLWRETGLPQEIDAAWTARHALQLYATLSPAQQEGLWRGAALPVAQMTPVQRELFAASLGGARTAAAMPSFRDALQRARYARLNREQLATGSLSLTTQTLLRTTVKRGGVVTGRTTEPMPPAVTSGEGSAPAAPRPSIPGSGADPPREEVIRQPVTDVSFVFRYGSRPPDTVHLTVAPVAQAASLR